MENQEVSPTPEKEKSREREYAEAFLNEEEAKDINLANLLSEKNAPAINKRESLLETLTGLARTALDGKERGYYDEEKARDILERRLIKFKGQHERRDARAA